MLSHKKIILVLILVLRYPIDKKSQEFGKMYAHILKDLDMCTNCFKESLQFCLEVSKKYEFDEDIIGHLNVLFGVKHIRLLKEKNNKSRKILFKYLANDLYFEKVINNEEESNYAYLWNTFFDKNRLDGMQFCPQSRVQRFIDFFARNNSYLNIWVYMNIDIQPILMPYLYSIGFPVPRTYASCGFSIFQSVDGIALSNLYSTNLEIKLQIAIQLLEGAITFSEGFNQFRIYITDLNMDNVVYDPETSRISFVDLDTVLIVDSKANGEREHKHKYIECDGCFAYSPADICVHNRSDINIFAVCQILLQDLRGNVENGFLYSVLQTYAEIKNLLNDCVDCPKAMCQNRFTVATKLITNLNEIVKINNFRTR